MGYVSVFVDDDLNMAKDREYSTKLFGSVGYLQRLSDNFGKHFVLQLFSTYLLVKGFTTDLVSLTMLPFFRTKIGVSGRQYQIFQQVLSSFLCLPYFCACLLCYCRAFLHGPANFLNPKRFFCLTFYDVKKTC